MRTAALIVLVLAGSPASGQIVLCTGNDIPGAVTFAGYEGCTSVSHYQEGLERRVTIGGGGLQAANPDFADISLTRSLDVSSNALRAAAINGSPRDWSLHFLSMACNGQRLEYQRVNLTNALVSGFSAAAIQDLAPTETLGLTFTAIEYVQTLYDPSCQVTNVTSFGWDRLSSSPTP